VGRSGPDLEAQMLIKHGLCKEIKVDFLKRYNTVLSAAFK